MRCPYTGSSAWGQSVGLMQLAEQPHALHSAHGAGRVQHPWNTVIYIQRIRKRGGRALKKKL